MSIDLARTLHENVDSGPAVGPDGTSGIDLDALTARVRRRRTRRAVVRGAVGVGAAGAFAFAGVQVVGRRGPDDLLPAADPAAAPGTCGSAIDELPVSSAGEVVLTMPSAASGTIPDARQGAADRTRVLAGRAVTATLSQAADVAAWDGREEDVTTIELEVTRLVAADAAGTVVGTQTVPTLTEGGGQLLIEPATGAIHSVVRLEDVLTTCGPGGEPAGTALPDGRYSLYALSAATAEPQVLGGPWPLALEPALAELTDLPAAYPATEVPVVGNSLVTAVADRGSNPGWLVRTETNSVGAVDSAVTALEGAGAGSVEVTTMSSTQLTTMAGDPTARIVRTADWEVVIRQITDDGGRSVLQYQLEPR